MLSTSSELALGPPGFHFIVPRSTDTVEPLSGLELETHNTWSICLENRYILAPYQT